MPISLSTGKKTTVKGSIHVPKDPVLNPGHERRAERAEPQSVDRLEAVFFEK